MSIEVKGFIEVSTNLKGIISSVPKSVGQALQTEAEIEAVESRKRTPVEFGTLAGSHDVAKAKIKGKDISVEITVGKNTPAESYALVVHEDLDAIHPKGQAKFLESTLMESKPFMAERIAKRLGNLAKFVK